MIYKPIIKNLNIFRNSSDNEILYKFVQKCKTCQSLQYPKMKFLIKKNYFLIRGAVQKKNSIFKDIVQIGGREVNPISKNKKEMIFWQKLEREGITKYIVKNRSTQFCIIHYFIWPNQGTLCLSVCTPDPQKVIGIN